ncbi:hypothetical protein CHGG_10226 [Chaetomium globosum CBS 148.51]|uniref:Uncharacterized protein n=1 Tax=Chaetomium globosum (strain ATCC 6205 / CBS 148.51 / DSM 1962 / NBRC 6347 / NRRL 1970) TaxID=306901 RepID=Q2GP78_CHAGB|nr:uncharacterized protein CHGG_10226 [Chaetomium globosum CBS 148.51]EAQ83822.1 hypothetical protein CHGG_10226 [Chaetomium globosum CBS 148.51]
MSVPRARLLALMKLFSTTYNPEGIRTGNKILRQRLRGPALASYYPRKVMAFRDFQDEFRPLELEVENDDELDRLEHVAAYIIPSHYTSVCYSNWPQSQSSREGVTEEGEGSGNHKQTNTGVYSVAPEARPWVHIAEYTSACGKVGQGTSFPASLGSLTIVPWSAIMVNIPNGKQQPAGHRCAAPLPAPLPARYGLGQLRVGLHPAGTFLHGPRSWPN